MDGLEAGEYRAHFAAQKFIAPDPVPFRIVPGTDLPALEVRLTPHGSIQGRVVDQELRPVPGITVELTVATRSGPLIARTGERGEFAFDDLPPGGYYLVARPSLRGGADGAQPLPTPVSQTRERLVVAPTWYPGVSTRAGAARILAAAGERR